MVVHGDGPTPARFLLLGESPSKDEDYSGRPFSGRAGQLLDRYFGRTGVPERDDLYLTYVVKARSDKPRTPTADDLATWLPALCGELLTVQPSCIVTFGKTALSLFLPDLSMEAAHGIPHDIPLDHLPEGLLGATCGALQWPTPGHVRLFPCYHPAFALYDPTMQSVLTFDIERFGQYVQGRLPIRHVASDAHGRYVRARGRAPLKSALVGVDTEGYRGAAWGLSYSDQDQTGVVVKAEDARNFSETLEYVHTNNSETLVVLHHALHDLPILREMGIDLVEMGVPLADTMVAAYFLGLEPQGLKALCYRHCGMVMGDYLDLTAQSDERIARTWLTDVALSLPAQPTSLVHGKKCAWWHAGDDLACSCAPKTVKADCSPETADLVRARSLLLRMLVKHEGKPLRSRWTQKKCAARVILEEELAVIGKMPLPTLDDVVQDHDGDETPVIDYAGADADGTRRLYPILKAQIDAYGLTECYEVTTGIIPMIDRMQAVGISVDLDHFAALVPIFEGRAAGLDAQITEMTGAPLNASSGDQVATLLFDKMRLHKAAPNLRLKRTDAGRYSTDDKALEALDGLHPLIALLRQRREMTKLLGSYVRPIPKMVGSDGRLHCELLLTRTDTGRLAAKNPNLLAWPKHSENALMIRHGFVAGPGREFAEYDLSQIEARVFAHDAGEWRMLVAFASGHDVHAETASRIFGRPYDDIIGEYRAKTGLGGEQRFAGKAIVFGIIMGITEYGLMGQFHKNGQLHWTLDDCRKLLSDWRLAFPDAAAYIQAKHAEARRYSYVRDMFGRMRWLDGVHSEDDYIRAEAERMAQATPVQSGAQGIMQRAMRNLWPDLAKLRRCFWVEPLLQTHDALMFEYDAEHRDELTALVQFHLAHAVTLSVEISSSASFGHTWGEL